MTDFVHLHVHSHYSLLDSTVKIPDLLERVRELGMEAVAVTDHGAMYNAVELQQRASAMGVKPIFGVELYVLPEGQPDNRQTKPHHLVVLAETLAGYRNMIRLVTRGWVHGLDDMGRPCVTKDDLDELSAGLIGLSADLGGEIAQALLRNDRDGAEAVARRYQEIFGRDSFFLELQRHEGVPEYGRVCDQLVELGRAIDAPLVATNDVHYLREGDVEAHAVLMCVGMDKRIHRDILEKIPLRTLYVRSPDEMAELFADLPEAIENTVEIANRCDVEIPLGETFLPPFPTPEGMDEAAYLRTLSVEGLERRLADAAEAGREIDRAEYEERLDHELTTIEKMGYPGYFLIVWDFIDWARRQGIPVGPGRGSGAGSLVAYCLTITDIDPLRYDLLFERFLNIERVSMPDFDIDFCQNRRGEVIEYVTQKYGEQNVAQIVTFGQLKAKAVVRDVARVLDLPYAESDRLAKMVPTELGITLADAYQREPQLREAIHADDKIQFLYDVALALEGNYRNTGVHAAGVVISDKPIWEYVPASVGADGELVTQYAKDEVEAAGLIKFDFLGLRNLTVIQHAIELIDRNRPADEKFDWKEADLREPKVYELIQSADTIVIFQMESDGFRRLMPKLRPDCFEDIVAAVALFRPGPLGSGMVDQFVACKHGRRRVEYPHPWLEEVLEETYGVMVYQEQVMEAARRLAGYTLGGADILRRAMGKKKPKEMARQREIFVKGAGEKGIDAKKAHEIFDLMATFAGYGFNKSHSAAYAMVTFQTAYLKALYPTEFYAALMTMDADRTDRIVQTIRDARKHDVQVLPPDVNESEESFTVAEGKIRFGLGAIKGLGSAAIEAIAEARADGPFESLFDFCERVDLKRVNKRAIEALIACGAFDVLEEEGAHRREDEELDQSNLRRIGRWRARLSAAVESAIDRGTRAREDAAAGQSNLLGLLGEVNAEILQVSYPDATPWSGRKVLAEERRLLGFFISGHPLDRFADEIAMYATGDTRSVAKRGNNDRLSLAGIAASVRERSLKNKDGRMAFVQLEDLYGRTEVVLYSEAYAEAQELIASDDPLLIKGRIRIRGDGEDAEHQVVAESVQRLSAAREGRVGTVWLEVPPERLDDHLLGEITDLLSAHPGSCRVGFRLPFASAEAQMVLPRDVQIEASDALIDAAHDLLGERCLRFE